MADEILLRDQNHVTVAAGITNDSDQDVTMLRQDPVTKRLLVDAISGGGSSGLATETTLLKVPGLSIPIYDYVSLSYTGSNLTGCVFKEGGSSGTTVATLTLAYDGSNNLTSVTKS